MRPVTLAPAPGGDRVLFVGNSLTEGNDLPLMVDALSRAGGHALAVEAVTSGGVVLEDWNLGTQHRIAAGGFRFVVLSVHMPSRSRRRPGTTPSSLSAASARRRSRGG
jgi:hypothetical protein